jgi:hypothetical protein
MQFLLHRNMEDNIIYSVLTSKLDCGQCSWIYDAITTHTWYHNYNDGNNSGCNGIDGTDPSCTCGPMPSYDGSYMGQQVLVDCT